MAKTPKAYDFSSRSPSWANELEGNYKNASARVDGAIKALLESGEVDSVSEDERRRMITQLMTTGNFDLQRPVEQPVLPSATPVEPEAPGYWASRMQELRNAGSVAGEIVGNPDAATYFENTLAASSAQEELSDIQADEQGGPIADFLSVAANRIGLADMVSTMTGENVEGKDIVGLYRNLGRELTAGTRGPGLAAMFTDPSTVIDNIISPQRAKERMEAEQAERDARKSAAQSKLQTATANLEGLDVGLLTEGTLGAVATAIGQPEQVLPTAGALVGGALGGPAAASAGATLLSYPMAETAYIGAKNQAKEQFGANEEEATMYGLLVASVQVGSEGVGGPLESAAVGIAKRAGLRSLTKEAAEDWLAKKIRSRTSRVLGGAAVEAGEEVAAAAGQDAIEKALEVTEFFDSPEGQEALREHNLENAATWGRRYAQQGLGGFTVGGIVAAPVAHGAVRAEQSQRAAEDEAGILGNLLTEKALDRRARKEVGDAAAKADTELAQDIAFEEQRIANEQAKQQAFEQAEKAAAEQRELEEEAGFQTLERGDVSPSSRVERYADVVERVPVEPAREVRPEDVAEQRASAERAEQERQERVRQGKLAEEIRKEREKIAKAKANEEKKLTKAQKDAARKQRADVRRELVEQNPDASDLEIGEMLEQRMANMPAPEVLTDPVEQKAASALKNITTSRKRAASTAETKRMNALARKNPDATPQELAALFNGQAPQAAPVLPEAAPTQTATPAPETAQTTSPEQQERDSALEAMGITLGMARESNDTRGNGQRTVKDYMPVARRIADAISRRSDRKGRAVSGLIRQGKLVIAPNAEFVGYEEKGRAAEFDPDTGKLYIYSDHINPDQIVPAILEAVAHEGTHGTTRTPRDGRAALMQSLLGENGVAESVGKIRAAAKKGNKIAQEAVRLAEADTKQRRELGETNPARFEDEEVIAYFSGEAVANREKPLGSVAGVVRDIRTAARSFLRDKAGLDLDVDLSDLNTAAQNVLAETARTSLRPTQGDRLGMIVGPHHPAYGKAKLTYKGAVDNLDRTEIPDYQVEVDQSVLKNLDNLKATTLKEILPHKELYDGYAKQRLGDYRVAADPNLEAYARYDGKTISLNKTLIHLANTIPEAPSPFEDFSGLTNLEALRRSILHETQHAVQEIEDFVPGANPRSFIPRSYINRLERAQENYNKVITNFDLGRAVSTLTPQVRSVWNNEVLAAANLTRNGKAQLFLAQEYYEDSTDRMIQLYGPRYHEAAEALAAAREDYDIARDTAYATYLRDYGETEARNTEHRSRMTPEELAANAPEDTMGDAAGNVPVGRTLDTAQYVGGTRRPPQSASRATSSRDRGGHSLGMAARETNTPTETFREWFGNSVAVNEDGSPKRYYTGTSKDKDFKAFNVPKNGVWFTADPEEASMYARDNDSRKLVRDDSPGSSPWALREVNTSDRVFPVYLRAESPYTLTPEDKAAMDRPGYKRAQADLFSRLKAQGYDSVIWDPQMSTIAIIGDATQIKSVLNDNPTNRSRDVLGMAARSPAPRKVPLTKRFAGLFDSAAFTSPEIREILEHAKTSPAEQRLLAAGLQKRFNKAVEREAKARGMTPENLTNKMIKELDAVDKSTNNLDENKANFLAVVSKYGDAGRVMTEFRDLVDGLSQAILNQRAELVQKGVPLTAKEKKAYQAIGANMGRYSHRQFAVNINSNKNKYANKLLDDYEKGVKEGKDKLTPAERKNYDRYVNGFARIIEDIMIPDVDTLLEMDADDINDLYSVWGKEDSRVELTHEEKVDALIDMADKVNSNTDAIEQEAEVIVREILGLSETTPGRISSRIRGNTVDRSILKERTQIAPEIRELMGEITDPGQRLFVTVSKLGEFVARNKMMAELSEINNPKHIQPPGRAGRPEVKGMRELTSEAYGALQGYWVSENLHGLLSDTVEQLATFEQAVAIAASRPDLISNKAINKVIDEWKWTAGKTKMLQIMGKPFNFLMNFAGGPRTLLMNGNINPVHVGKAILTARDLIRNSIDPSFSSPESRRVTALGITDSAFIGELTHEEHAKLLELLDEMVGKSPSQIAKIWRRAGAFVKEGYSMMDVMYKIAGFYQQAAYFDAYHKANGENLTQRQIDRKAADSVNYTYVTYKRALPLAKVLERGGITMFGTYFTETIRTDINALRKVVQEYQMAENAATPEAREVALWQATRRLTGIITTWGLTVGLAKLASQLVFGDDEEDERKLRAMLPDFIRDADFAFVGNKGKNAVLFAWSTLDPSGPVGDAIRGAVNGDFSAREMAAKVFDLYVAPRIGKKLWDAVGVSTGMTEDRVPDPISQQLFPELYSDVLSGTSRITNPVTRQSIDDNTVRAWTNVLETFTPGMYGALRESNPAPDMDSNAAIIANILRWGGASLYELDPVKAARMANFDYEDTVKNSKRRLADLGRDRVDLSAADIEVKLRGMVEAERRDFHQLRLVVGGMEALGMSSREITLALKEAGLDSKLISAAKSGKFVPITAVSKRSLENAMKREMVGKTEAEKKEIKAKWKSVEDAFKSARQEGGEE